MKTILGLFISFFLTANCMGQPMKFECHEIGNFKDRMGQTSLIDIDNDNDLDWVFGRRGEMFWYEYVSPTIWVLHELGKGASTDVGGCPHDVNQDGWIDYIVGDSWYENTKNPLVEPFLLHKKNMISCHDNIVVDVDGDNIKDVISVSNDPDHPVLCWYKIPEDYTSNWNYLKIAKGIHGGIAPMGYGDLDKDGDVDVVSGNAWFENIDAKGQKWTLHENLTPVNGSRPDIFGLALKTWCIDLDKDGDVDVVQAEADTKNGRVFWFENQNKGERFTCHLISKDTTNQDFHSLVLADFDGDGDIDICSGGGPLTQEKHKLFIWENKSGDAKKWYEHIILEGKRIHEAIGADVDFDGDIDICTKPWNGGQHIFLENKLID